MIELRTFTLLPWIRRIEACLDAQFPAGTETKINTDSMLRADTATRYSAYSTALAGGWMTVDEIRALEDRPPLPEQVSTDPADAMPPPPPPPAPTPPPVVPAEQLPEGAGERHATFSTADVPPPRVAPPTEPDYAHLMRQRPGTGSVNL
jgi:hypothetical protein